MGEEPDVREARDHPREALPQELRQLPGGGGGTGADRRVLRHRQEGDVGRPNFCYGRQWERRQRVLQRTYINGNLIQFKFDEYNSILFYLFHKI